MLVVPTLIRDILHGHTSKTSGQSKILVNDTVLPNGWPMDVVEVVDLPHELYAVELLGFVTKM